jgi:hypothetical protein
MGASSHHSSDKAHAHLRIYSLNSAGVQLIRWNAKSLPDAETWALAQFRTLMHAIGWFFLPANPWIGVVRDARHRRTGDCGPTAGIRSAISAPSVGIIKEPKYAQSPIASLVSSCPGNRSRLRYRAIEHPCLSVRIPISFR